MKIEKISLKHKEAILEMCKEYNLNNEDYNGAFFIKNIIDYEEKIKELDNASNGILDNPAFVPYTCYVFIIENKIVGVGSVRHYLNEYLEKFGGHIGYSIRPTERKKGYGSKALELLINQAKEMNIEKILITCNINNIGSKKVIENNNGKFINQIDETLRFEIK
jgi:predicted acetyltransferase